MASWTIQIKMDLSPDFVRLQPDRTIRNLRKCLETERDIGSGFWIEHEQGVRHRAGVKALPRELSLLLLERLGRIELARDADEDGAGIDRQALRQMCRQCRDIE